MTEYVHARARRHVVATVVCGLTLASCGSSASETAVERPPAPRIGERGDGPDPISELEPRPRGVRAPTPPVADPGREVAGSGLPSPAGRDATLYVIGDRSLTSAELGDFILRYFPDRAREPLGQLVDEALVEHEAAREGVTVSVDQVKARADAYLEERRREVRVQYGADATLEDLLQRSFGRTLAEFGDDAKRLARVGLLRDRLVRLEQQREERVEVRALTFPDEEEALRAVERLRGGADMTLLATRLGMRPPSAPPPLARADIQPAERAEELFATSAGDVLAPRAFTAPDGAVWWEVIKVIGAWPADARPWTQLRDDIEASLADRVVGVPEYLAWRRRVLHRIGVEVRREGRGLVPWIENR